MATNVVKSFQVGGFEYELKNISCGKANCNRCPHGPYWYMKFKTRHGKSVLKYLGKSLPDGISEP